MTGQVTSLVGGEVAPSLYAENDSVSVPNGSVTDLLDIPTDRLSRIGVQVKVAVQALNAFVIRAKMHPSGDYMTLYSTSIAYTSPTGLLIATSSDLTALAAGSSGWFVLDVSGLYAVQVQVEAAVSSAVVTAYVKGS